MDKAAIGDEAQKLGPMGRVELITAGIVTLFLALWVSAAYWRLIGVM